MIQAAGLARYPKLARPWLSGLQVYHANSGWPGPIFYVLFYLCSSVFNKLWIDLFLFPIFSSNWIKIILFDPDKFMIQIMYFLKIKNTFAIVKYLFFVKKKIARLHFYLLKVKEGTETLGIKYGRVIMQG